DNLDLAAASRRPDVAARITVFVRGRSDATGLTSVTHGGETSEIMSWIMVNSVVTAQTTHKILGEVPFCSQYYWRRMAGSTGLEPAASAVTGQRSNQL